MNQKFVFAGLFFLFILLSGLWLSRTGKPINVFILTIHKLISLAAIVFLGITVYGFHQLAPLAPFEIGAGAAALLLFVALFATGGLLSASRPMPGFVLKIHQITPFLVIPATAAALYGLLVVRL